MVGDSVVDVDVLDLFAGSGALGIEALSRGARHVDFVDLHPRALRTIRDNVGAFDLEEKSRVRRLSWESALAADRREGRVYGLVLLDPPYALISDIAPVLADALEPVLAAGAVIVAEGPRGMAGWPSLGYPHRDRRHGGTSVSVYRREVAP